MTFEEWFTNLNDDEPVALKDLLETCWHDAVIEGRNIQIFKDDAERANEFDPDRDGKLGLVEEIKRLAIENERLRHGECNYEDWEFNPMTGESLWGKQPVSQEPVGTAGELFTLSTLERLDVRPSTKVYLDSTPPVAEIVLKSCIYFDSIDFSQKPPFLRYDTGDSTPQDNWNVYCDIQDELREFGYELTDSDVDHDTVCGDVTPMAAAIRSRSSEH